MKLGLRYNGSLVTACAELVEWFECAFGKHCTDLSIRRNFPNLWLFAVRRLTTCTIAFRSFSSL